MTKSRSESSLEMIVPFFKAIWYHQYSMSSQLLDSNDGMESITDGEDEEELLPQIYACFLIRFDKRIGYTIAWNRARDGCERRVLVTCTCNRIKWSDLSGSKHRWRRIQVIAVGIA